MTSLRDDDVLERAASVLPPVSLHDDGAEFARRNGLRPAATLTLLIPANGTSEARMLLTRRGDHLPTHAGDSAFPGGSLDADDPDPASAALRETSEEVGVPPHRIRMIGALSPIRAAARFYMMPFVGLALDSDLSPSPCSREVAEVFEPPLSYLLNPRNHRDERRGGRRRCAIQWNGRRIWGATAAAIEELAHRLRDDS